MQLSPTEESKKVMPDPDEEYRLRLPLTEGGPLYILASFVPTPQDVVERMLELANITDQDVVYDLGCGDGRVVITAARNYGARGVGVDIEPHWVDQSVFMATQAKVDHLVTFSHQDALTTDLSPATVVTLYLVSWSTAKLQPIIRRQVKPGTRIISHSFGVDDWEPVKVERFTDSSGSVRTLYLWVVEDTVGSERG